MNTDEGRVSRQDAKNAKADPGFWFRKPKPSGLRVLRVLACQSSVFGLAVLIGCQSAKGPGFEPRGVAVAGTAVASPASDPAWLQPPTKAFTLGPGDRLEIEVLGETGTRAPVTVGPDGKIYYYLLPGLRVEG